MCIRKVGKQQKNFFWARWTIALTKSSNHTSIHGGSFWGCSRMRGAKSWKLDTTLPGLKKIQNNIYHVIYPLDSASISISLPEISNFFILKTMDENCILINFSFFFSNSYQVVKSLIYFNYHDCYFYDVKNIISYL